MSGSKYVYYISMRQKILRIVIIVLILILLSGFLFHNKIDSIFNFQKNTICPDPLVLDTPVDLDKATSILYPGQVRGGDFKRHGGFRFDNKTNNQVEVTAPIDAVLTSASRYLEMEEVQYLLDFETECGIKFRFDHLLTLVPKIAVEVEKLPSPKPGDSRTTNLSREIHFAKGEVFATAIGLKNNVFVDFGVYKTNGIFESPIANPICWFDLLSKEAAQVVKDLPSADSQNGKESTICK